jgi:uncharacterized protein YndB with AHSA1/START domain
MNPQPTGRLRGNDLILTRTFRAPIEDVWTSISDPESTARWFGRWEGERGAGGKIRVQMAFEKDGPWMDATIELCEAPRHLIVTTKDSYGEWRLELTLTQTNDTTTLEFVHHLTDRTGVGEVGPGWEYYLDNLVAARANQPLPTFEMYYPSQKDYFLSLP